MDNNIPTEDVVLPTNDTVVPPVTDETKTDTEVDVALADVNPILPPKKAVEMVPLPKYMDAKNEVKDLKAELEALKSQGAGTLTNTNLDSLIAKYDVDPGFVTDILNIAKKEVMDEVQSTINPLIAEKQTAENDKSFNTAFDNVIVKKYGDQINREAFKEIALNPAFAYLKSFDGVVQKFFSHVTPISTDAAKVVPEDKDETIEGGSTATPKNEIINFANMTPAQHETVLADPVKKAEYYKWKDTQV